MINSVLQILGPVVEGLLGGHGWAMTLISWIGVLRLVFKPLMTFVVDLEPVAGTAYANTVTKLMNSSVYSSLVFVLDWVASLKLPTGSNLPAPPTTSP